MQAIVVTSSSVQPDQCSDECMVQLQDRMAALEAENVGLRSQLSQLTKASEVLQASLQQLAEAPELERFLGHILTVCVERFGAAEAGIWRFEEGIFRLFIAFEEGTIRLRSSISHPGSQLEVAQKIRNQDVLARLRQREIVADYEEDFKSRVVYDQFRDYFQQRGIQSVLKIPMFLDQELRGILVLRFAERRHFADEKLELVRALANQAVIALELTRLAEKAGQAAAAEQKETIAKAQAQEFARINQLLRNSLRYLSSPLQLSDVLGQLLLEIIRHAAAATGHIFLYDAAAQTLTLSVRSRDQQVFWTASEEEPSLFKAPIAVAIAPIFTDLCQHSKLVILQQEEFEGRLWPGVGEWFQANGYVSTSCCVLMIGDQPLGLLLMTFLERTALSPVDEELILTLTHQMALLIKLTALADEAKQTALLQERNRLASEIHDTLAQAFTAISIQLGVAKRIAGDNPSEVMRIIDRVMALTNAALAQARASVWALHPTAEEFADLAAKLSDHVEQMAEATPLKFHMQIVGAPYLLSPMMGKNLLRIGQEAITNALKHAEASQLKVRLTYREQLVSLCVKDDGKGFVFPADTEGFGLISLSERADRIGGHLMLSSELGQGTEICIQVPVESL